MAPTSQPSDTQNNSKSHEYPYGFLVPQDGSIQLPRYPYLDKSTPQYRERCTKIIIGAEQDLSTYRQVHEDLKREVVDVVGKIDQLEWNLRYIYPLGDLVILQSSGRQQLLEGHAALMKHVQELAKERSRLENQIRACRSMIEHYKRLVSAGIRDLIRATNETAFIRVQDSWTASELDALEKRDFEDIRATKFWDDAIDGVFEKMNISRHTS